MAADIAMSLGGTLVGMPEVRPFRALRYDEAVAGPLERLVAPPYDVISPAEREDYLARSPYNVVHLTLPESEERAARDLAAWRRERVLVEDEPAVWWLAQDYVGPDGVARTREGFAASVRVEPYESGAVVPHERTHAGPKEGRLRLLRATRTQLEPIFLLYDADPPLTRPGGQPDLEVEEGAISTRAWRVTDADVSLDVPLLIADGHHRYETAVAFQAEDPGATHTFAVLVSARAPGLVIFPTHRVVERLPDGPRGGDDPLAALRALEDEPRNGAAAVLYRKGGAAVVRGGAELDTQLVETFAPTGLTYTPRAEEAVARVDAGEAEAAFLLRPPALDEVWRVASRGEVMPQKTTYFFPKLVSGLLFHPL
jgi:uncharacterized protein (DUF1015 family)